MLNLHDRDWKEFYIKDIFSINPGKRLTKSNMLDGNKPFIGATDSNNGVTAFVSNSNISEDRNVLGVNYNGSVVERPECVARHFIIHIRAYFQMMLNVLN